MPVSSADWRRSFFTFWTGQALSLFGSALVQFALVWWLTATTGSGTVLATATLVALLPNVFLAPAAGVLVDRWNRRVIMIVSDSIVALATVGLAVLFALDVVRIWHVYLVLFVRAAVGTFQLPASQASTSLMVPAAHLSRIAGLSQMLQGAMSIAAPPVGALLLDVLPMQGVLSLDVVTALVAVATLCVVAVPQPPQRLATETKAGSFWSELGAGLRYTWAWPGLMAIMTMATAINFFVVAAFALMPILVTKHFGGGAVQLAALSSTFGVGAMAGGVVLGAWGGFHRRILTSLMGLIGIGLGLVIMGLTPATMFWLAVAAAFLAAVMLSMTNGPIMAVLQAAVAPDMQGRVLTLMVSAATAISPLGLAIAGPVADRLGVQVWYIAGGLMCIGMGTLAFSVPSITRMEDHRAGTPPREAKVPAPTL